MRSLLRARSCSAGDYVVTCSPMRRDTMAERRYLTTFSFRGRWVYRETRRKWKRRNFKVPFGWVIVVSYKRISGDALDESEEIALPDTRRALEQLARWPEGNQQRPSAPVQARWQDLRLPDRDADQSEARRENGNDLEAGISGVETPGAGPAGRDEAGDADHDRRP